MDFTLDLEVLRDRGIVHSSWALALATIQPQLNDLEFFYAHEIAAGRKILPVPDSIMRVFEMPLDAIRVLIVGQDPYPTPGYAIGLAFAVDLHVSPLPRSLSNILQELRTDTGVETVPPADLSTWVNQGVMLLNRVLTVRAGEAGSHQGRGWEAVTEQAIRVLAARELPLVAILWGKQAQTLRPLLGQTPVLASPHPSPLSARRGFFGSRPFTTANDLLAAQGAPRIDFSRGGPTAAELR